jgi:hypothetical protein
MSPTQFGLQLFLIIVASILIIFLIPVFKLNAQMAFLSLGLFALVALQMYIFGRIALKSTSKNTFGVVFMGLTTVKMIGGLSLVLVYDSLYKPTDDYFVLPFFTFFIIFTVFETYFMTRLGKTTS